MDPRAYEEEVLALVKVKLKAATRELTGHDRVVDEVTLRGSYPDSEIVVGFDEHGRRREETWKIWDLPIPQKPSSPWDPESLATLVYAHMTEP